MSFVFVPSAPSDRARRLARQLESTIESFRRENPSTSGTDIRQALHLVQQSSVPGARTVIILGAILAVILGLGLLFFMENR